MRKLFCSLVILLSAAAGYSQQQPRVVDSVQQLLAKSTTDADKFKHTAYLSRVMMTMNPQAADQYGQQLIQIAQISRNRGLMVEAFLVNAERFSYLAGRKDNIFKSIGYYNQALELAKKNKMDTSVVRSYLGLSAVYRYLPDYEKALNFCNQANSYSSAIKDDSIKAKVNLEYGLIYLSRNEKVEALKKFLSASRAAEELKSISLQRESNTCLSVFYAAIGDYEKAIDKQVASLNLLQAIASQPGTVYRKIDELNKVGNLYSADKNYDMAFYYYEQALKLSDSIRYDPIKPMTYNSIINNYMKSGQPQKALDYFNAHPQLKDFLQKVNFGHFTDLSYGHIYLKLGKYDSAKYYYNKVDSFFEKDVNNGNKYNYYSQLGLLYMKTGELDKSISYFLRAKQLVEDIGSLEEMSDVVQKLDTLYQQKGDFKQAYAYASLNTKYKDSLNKLSKARDLMQEEADDVRLRAEREIKEKEEIKRRRNNIQYISIIFGIVLMFVTLAVLGMFKVSAGLIKGIGFFVFLMLFEFIFLIFKKNIYAYTHGEPLKDLAFMIGLAALLVPLHHWMEHKVLKYLTSHNRLTAAGHHIKNKLFRRTKGTDGDTA